MSFLKVNSTSNICVVSSFTLTSIFRHVRLYLQRRNRYLLYHFETPSIQLIHGNRLQHGNRQENMEVPPPPSFDMKEAETTTFGWVDNICHRWISLQNPKYQGNVHHRRPRFFIIFKRLILITSEIIRRSVE